ncbi:amidase [Pseudoroseomonas deserti]|uniref:Amidase n=1 Tax=Teichococcus deserti TaxID=1817963 RepID=A0A1V2GXQ7_9PROT|nr:amidase family protein [Pseudoroseomonas deserti]ONG49496.1 amidase [Pseudoroseomonas deserti]
MQDEDLGFAPATALARMIVDKVISPVELTTALLRRIAALEPRLNAFALLVPEQALAQARAAEQAVMQGAPLGRLHGVPITIKDHEAIAGLPTEFGSATRKGDTPGFTTPMAARMLQEGAILLGKTTTSEFGWKGVSQSPLTGITHNPWKHGYNAGASSAGAGVAAAAGYGPLHQSGDGAGSIRMPAHFCGAFGFKPSFGRVPVYPPGTGDNTLHLGPMTRNVADAALMLQVMAGPHPWDPTSLEAPPADYTALLRQPPARRPRIAFSPDLGHARVDAEVAQLVRQAVEGLEQVLGHAVDQPGTPWGPQGPELARYFWPAHFSRFGELLPQWEDQMDPGFVACIRAGSGTTVAEYQRMRIRKYAYGVEIHRFFEAWDFLLTPAVSVAAFPADRLQPEHWPQHPWDWLSWAEFSYPFNLSGNPACSIPCGFTAAGLPVGLQIVGRRFDDLGVLQLAAQFEAIRPWAQHRPPLAMLA